MSSLSITRQLAQRISTVDARTVSVADIVGITAAGTAIVTAASAAAQTALLDAFTTAAKGLAPASGGGTANFLRADGTWAAPAGGGGISDGDKGDITVSGVGTVWTIDPGSVTLAKQADVATARIMGRTTAGTGSQEALTAAQVKALLAIAAGDVSGLGTLATQSGTFSGASSGTNTGDETAAGILAKLITVDGVGSGLDADLLDGLSSAAFATAAQGTLAASASQPGHTHTAANITDFAAAVAANSAVAANTAKVTNATHTGDATGSTALTLATVNANVGSFGLAASVGQFTVNAKGLITAAANVAIAVASTAITDLTTAIMTLAGVQTVTGAKTFTGAVLVTDNLLSIRDDVDATKQAQFNAAGITTATTRIYDLPNVSGTFAILSGLAQTFANTTSFSGNTFTVGSVAIAGTVTYGFGPAATPSASTKAINIGTGSLSGSTTNVQIGSAVSGGGVSINQDMFVKCPAPTNFAAAATVTAADIAKTIITYSGAAATLTMPTGALLDALFTTMAVDTALRFSVINTGSGTATIAAGTGGTIVPAGAGVAAATSDRWVMRKTAAATYVFYRA